MKERNYGRWMEEKMAEVRGIARDYVRMRNIKRASVLEFGKLIAPSAGQSDYLQEEEIWGEDPVHYTQKGYKMAAAGLESLVYEKKSEEKDEEAKPNPPKKPKLDLTKKQASLGPGQCGGGGEERRAACHWEREGPRHPERREPWRFSEGRRARPQRPAARRLGAERRRGERERPSQGSGAGQALLNLWP
jgi:hypothetical protein